MTRCEIVGGIYVSAGEQFGDRWGIVVRRLLVKCKVIRDSVGTSWGTVLGTVGSQLCDSWGSVTVALGVCLGCVCNCVWIVLVWFGIVRAILGW